MTIFAIFEESSSLQIILYHFTPNYFEIINSTPQLPDRILQLIYFNNLNTIETEKWSLSTQLSHETIKSNWFYCPVWLRSTAYFKPYLINYRLDTFIDRNYTEYLPKWRWMHITTAILHLIPLLHKIWNMIHVVRGHKLSNFHIMRETVQSINFIANRENKCKRFRVTKQYIISYIAIWNISISVKIFLLNDILYFVRVMITDYMKYFQFWLLHLELISAGIWRHVEMHYYANHFGKWLLLFKHLEKCNL